MHFELPWPLTDYSSLSVEQRNGFYPKAERVLRWINVELWELRQTTGTPPKQYRSFTRRERAERAPAGKRRLKRIRTVTCLHSEPLEPRLHIIGTA